MEDELARDIVDRRGDGNGDGALAEAVADDLQAFEKAVLAQAPRGSVVVGVSISPDGRYGAALTFLRTANYLMDDVFSRTGERWELHGGGSGGGISWSSLGEPDSEIAQAVNRDYVTFKEVERPKFLPSQIVRMMHEEGFPRFLMHRHTELWQSLDAKNPGKGWGVEVAGAWYWYSSWIEVVRSHCEENASNYW